MLSQICEHVQIVSHIAPRPNLTPLKSKLLKKKTSKGFIDNLSYFSIHLKQVLLNFWFLFSFLSCRMSKNMCKEYPKLKKVKNAADSLYHFISETKMAKHTNT